MSNPEFPRYIDINENKNILREALGKGSQLFDQARATDLLNTKPILSAKERTVKLSYYPQFVEEAVINNNQTDYPHASTLNMRQRAGVITSKCADLIEVAAIHGSLVSRTKHDLGIDEAKVTMVLLYDFSIGMRVVPVILNKFEDLLDYDDAEGIRNEHDKSLIGKYKAHPVSVLKEHVKAHAQRFKRENEETGIYVPEFINAGLSHGEKVFTIAYQQLQKIK